MACVFAVQVQSWLNITCVAVQSLLQTIYLSPVTKLDYGHWRDRGIMNLLSVLIAGAKAKTVTNNLPLLSVLGVRSYLFVKV